MTVPDPKDKTKKMHLLNSYIEVGRRYSFEMNVPSPKFSGTVIGTVVQKQMIEGTLYVLIEDHKGLNLSHLSKVQRIG